MPALKKAGVGPALTIDTDSSEPVPVTLPDRRGPNGTPRSSSSWFTSSTPLAPNSHPRSWLQSPRKWGQGRTPTHAQGADSERKAVYLATLRKQKKETGEELFGQEDEEEEQMEGEQEAASTPAAGGAQQPAAAALSKPAPTTIPAGIVHQTDKDGRQLPQHQQAAAPSSSSFSSTSSSTSMSLLGRLLGRVSLLVVETASSISTSIASATTSRASPGRQPKQQKQQQQQQQQQGSLVLGRPHPKDAGKKCLVLDLDETLVHSSFTPVDSADFVVPILIEKSWHQVYVSKRPGVDEFLACVAEHYEIVIWTASLSLYADPLLAILDPGRLVRHRLYREDCTFTQGCYVKDLARLDRDVAQTIIVDNSPLSFLFQPQNAIGCSSFIDEPADRELDVVAAFLGDIKDCSDVREHCAGWREWELKKKPRAHHGQSKGKGKGKGKGKSKRAYVEAG